MASVLAAASGLALSAACAPGAPGAGSQATPKPAGTVAAGGAPTTAAAPGATSAPAAGGELRVISVAFTTVPGTTATANFDPHGIATNPTNVQKSLMFEGLTEMQPDGSLSPGLAKSWSISPDGTAYTFELQSGVRFHNGRAMTAADVVYSFQRIQDPASNHPSRNQYGIISKVEAANDSTAVFTLKQPYAPLLALLADIGSSIVPQEEAAKPTFAENPVGTGPFKLASQVTNQSVTLDANKSYWRPGLPRLERMTLMINSDPQAALLAFRAGQADMYYDAPGENIDDFKRDSAFVVHGGTGQPTFAWMLLNDNTVPAFKDVKVRQAIYWALDRATIAATSLPNLTDPLNAGFLPAGHWAALTTPVYSPDMAKAKQLLSETSVAGGLRTTLYSGSAVTHFPRATQIVQQQLKPLGIDVSVMVEQAGGNRLQNGDFEMYLHGTAGTLDPDQQFIQSFMPGGGRNYTKFADDEIAKLVQSAQATAVQAERARLYQQAQQRLAEVGPMAFLYTYNKYDVAYPRVKGYTYNAQINQWKQLREVWLQP